MCGAAELNCCKHPGNAAVSPFPPRRTVTRVVSSGSVNIQVNLLTKARTWTGLLGTRWPQSCLRAVCMLQARTPFGAALCTPL